MSVRYPAKVFVITIGLQQLHAVLRGGGGPDPTGDTFFRLLSLPNASSVRLSPSESAWQWAVAELFSVNMADVKDAEEPYEVFAERVDQGFDLATSVLAECSREGLDEWRVGGKEADVFIGGWLANEQLDLTIPAGFLAQCARLGLSIRICTND